MARASVYRHRQPPRDGAPRPSPRGLAPAERAQATLHEDRFVDRAPAAVYAILLEEGRYLLTMYRLLHDAGEVRERRANAALGPSPTRLAATDPDQSGTWYITRLGGRVKGGRIRSTW